MSDENLLNQLKDFLNSGRVTRLCRPYRTDPNDAIGELYCRLAPVAKGKVIDNPQAWVASNGYGVLQNWLRREIRTLV